MSFSVFKCVKSSVLDSVLCGRLRFVTLLLTSAGGALSFQAVHDMFQVPFRCFYVGAVQVFLPQLSKL